MRKDWGTAVQSVAEAHGSTGRLTPPQLRSCGDSVLPELRVGGVQACACATRAVSHQDTAP